MWLAVYCTHCTEAARTAQAYRVADLYVTAECPKACRDSKHPRWIIAPANFSSVIASQHSCIHFLRDTFALIKIQSIEALSRMVGFFVLHLRLREYERFSRHGDRFVWHPLL